MKTTFTSILFILIVICFSEFAFSQTIKWTSTGVNGIDSHQGWLIINNNPFELRFWKFDAQTHKITIMDGPLSNNLDYEIILSSNEYFNQDYFNVWNGDRLLKLDYNGDDINDLIINYSPPTMLRYAFRIIDITNGETLFQLDDDAHDYEVTAIYDYDGDGKYELAVMRTEFSTNLRDVLVYATNGSATLITDNSSDIPKNYKLRQNFPNPFNPSTTIKYQIPEAGNAEINIYDINGELIRTFNQQHNSSGEYSVTWDGKNNSGQKVSSNVYFYQLVINNTQDVKKMILLK